MGRDYIPVRWDGIISTPMDGLFVSEAMGGGEHG